MTYPIEQLVVTFALLTSGAIMILSMIVLRLTLDRRVRRYAMPPDWDYCAFPDYYLKGIARSVIFGLCCVFPHVNNAEMYRSMYNNIDVKAFANPFEKSLGWSMVIGAVVMLFICGPIIFITDWFDIWVWE